MVILLMVRALHPSTVLVVGDVVTQVAAPWVMEMWVVRAGDDVYVRSAGGPDRPWYRRAKACGAGRIRAGGVELGVTFAEATADAQASIDAAYHAKTTATVRRDGTPSVPGG